MVTKQEAVEKLKTTGFDAVAQEGILMIYGTDNIKAVKKAVRDTGYNGSYGCTNRERKDKTV